MHDFIRQACLFFAVHVFIVVSAPCMAEKVFLWTMESETADIAAEGSDKTPSYYPPDSLLRSTAQARSGKYSLDVSGGAWRAATFDNPTDNTVWASPTEGAIVFWWKYTGAFPDGAMLFQITGKSKDKKLDTDDGIGIRIDKGQLAAGYGWVQGEKFGSTRIKTKTQWEAGRWYRITLKWNKTGPVTLSLQIDDQIPASTKDPLGEMTIKAFHQILIGNDRKFVPEGLFIDDFTIYNNADFDTATTQPATVTTQPVTSDRR